MRIPTSVLQLTIRNSSLRKIGDFTFAHAFTSLVYLDLSGNNIGAISSKAFLHLSRLQYLNLSGNRITTLGSCLRPLVSLQRLDISDNSLAELNPESFNFLSSLSVFYISYNRINILSGGVFHSFSFLSEFRARHCEIYTISDDFYKTLSHIRTLDLGQNHVSSLPSSEVFGSLHALRFLFLDGNELNFLGPSQFSGLRLLRLSLAGNGIRRLSRQTFDGLTVENLDMSQNRLQSLSRLWLSPVAAHLTSLNLAHNPLRHLNGDVFEDLSLLEALNISACSISYLPSDVFLGLYSLRRLDTSVNHLQNISADMLKVFNRLAKVNLHHNLWHCNCHIKAFSDWLSSPVSAEKLECSASNHPEGCANMSCLSPEKFFGKPVSSVFDTDMEVCVDDFGKSVLPTSVQIVIVLSCLLFALGLLLVTMYLWRRGRTRKVLHRLFLRQKCTRDGHHNEGSEGETERMDPFKDCDNESLRESHASFVFRHYFDHMVTDPKLLEPTSPSLGGHSTCHKNDSVYSSSPSLYEASHNSHCVVVVGMESSV